MFEETHYDRRRFLGATAMTIAAAQLGTMGLANAQPRKTKPSDVTTMQPHTSTSFGPVKQIDAGLLNVGYVEAGAANGRAVMLLHGWSYDIHSYVDVAPLLASQGYRVIVPYLRGYGPTRFLSNETFRNGQQSVIALDIIHLMDALTIEQAIIGGFDWGARTANIMAALWAERCKATVAVSGYLIGSPAANTVGVTPHICKGIRVIVAFGDEGATSSLTGNRGDARALREPTVAFQPSRTRRWPVDGAGHIRLELACCTRVASPQGSRLVDDTAMPTPSAAALGGLACVYASPEHRAGSGLSAGWPGVGFRPSGLAFTGPGAPALVRRRPPPSRPAWCRAARARPPPA